MKCCRSNYNRQRSLEIVQKRNRGKLIKMLPQKQSYLLVIYEVKITFNVLVYCKKKLATAGPYFHRNHCVADSNFSTTCSAKKKRGGGASWG